MMVKYVTNFTNLIWTVGVCCVCGGFHTGFGVLGGGKLQSLVLTWSRVYSTYQPGGSGGMSQTFYF